MWTKILQTLLGWLPSAVEAITKNEKLIKASKRIAGLKPIKMTDRILK